MRFHFLHKAPLLMLAVMFIQMLVSFMTAPPAEEKVDDMVWSIKKYSEPKPKNWKGCIGIRITESYPSYY